MAWSSPVFLDLAAWCGSTTLGSRADARILRVRLMEILVDQDIIVCDFSHVDVLTSQFMDECFGKLWDQVSHDALKRQLRIRGLTSNNLAIWRFVLNHR